MPTLKHSADCAAAEANELADLAKRAQRGAKFYTGGTCARCAGTTRYVLTRACVVCTRRKSSSKSRAKREANHAEGMAALKRLGLC